MSEDVVMVELVGGPGCGRLYETWRNVRRIQVPLETGAYERGEDGRFYWRQPNGPHAPPHGSGT